MNESIIRVGTFVLDNYLKPAPKIAVKAILSAWIGRSVAIILESLILSYKMRNDIT